MNELNNIINIRSAEINDVANLAVLKQQVWVATYAVEGIRKEYSDYLLKTFTVSNEITTLNNSGICTKVIEINEHLVGCVKTLYNSKCPISISEDRPEISILYILERYTKIGLGKKLLENTILSLKEKGFNSVWLSAFHKNERALKFYHQNGFKKIGTTTFEMEGNKYKNIVFEYSF